MSLLDFFRSPGLAEYRRLADLNNGTVAILFEIRKGKKSKPGRMVLMVRNPRGYTIKTNELKRVVSTFNTLYTEQGPDTYCRFSPVDDRFTVDSDFITLKSTGERITVKKVPYYDGLLARNKN